MNLVEEYNPEMRSNHTRTVRVTFRSMPDQEAPRYIMSVASRLLGMHPQTLRKYERFGLVEPSRSVGKLRLYSDKDIARLRVIRYLVENLGLNLAGVEFALQVLEGLTQLQEAMAVKLSPELRAEFEHRIRALLQRIGPVMDER